MSVHDLSILIIDENRVRASIIEDGLREAGTMCVVRDPRSTRWRGQIAEIAPDVVVIDLENPDRDRLEHFFSLSRALQKPVAMFVDRSDASEIEAAVEAGVSAYVVDGLQEGAGQADPRHGDLALQRLCAADARARGGAQRARGSQDHRPGQGHPDEDRGALARPRPMPCCARTAMNQNRKIVEIAQSLITAAGLLEP